MSRAAALAAGLVALVLAGCTGVPSSSAPEAIQALDTGQASAGPPVPPNLDGGPRDIVASFLDANAANTSTHPTARAYLTPSASKGWHDDTATIIGNDYSISTYNTRRHTVTIYARELGTLSANGIYTPSLQGTGAGGEKQPFVMSLTEVAGQWRIAKVNTGLLLTDDQFRDTYRQQALYFYDVTEDTLVPDVRWSALDDRAQLADWLLTWLVDGPRPELQNAISTDTFPPQSDPHQITVQLGTPTLIEIPGSSQLDPNVRDRLAAQISQTLLETLAGREMSITDGGTPVAIPEAGGVQFTADDFTAAVGPPAPTPEVYYLDNGRIRDDTGKPLAGPAGDGSIYLSACAVGQPRPDGPRYIAGVVGAGATSGARLVVGPQRGPLRQANLQGPLSRPAFAPGRAEVWVGNGPRIYRVTIDAAGSHIERVPILTSGGEVVALRFSPEGSRIAVVISGAGGLTRLYIGSVVRGAGPPRVDSLKPISPEGVVVRDVAWLDSFKLFAIGYLAGSQDARTFETGVDGTDWTNEAISLPVPPDSVTAATSSSVWVSAAGFVWKQSGTSWVSAGPTGQTPGRAPVYLE
jgi:hypothetical protein